MVKFHQLERLSQLHEGYQKAFVVEGYPLLLIQYDGQTKLLLNQCPHAQASLLGSSIDTGSIQCRIHGMRFDLNSGLSASCNQSLRFFTVSYRGQFVGVDF